MLTQFRLLTRDCGTATLFSHHRRKQPRKADESAGPLESANLRQWFQDARGASALINASDVRLGVDEPDISAYGRADQATTNFLKHCIDLHLVRKAGRGCYEKL